MMERHLRLCIGTMIGVACAFAATSRVAHAGVGDQAADRFAAARALVSAGKFAEAEPILKEVDVAARDPALVSAARSNLAFCAFQQAKALADSEQAKALPLFQSAASAYRAALDVSPDDANAARGLEVSRRWIKKIQDQQQDQKSQQQRQKQPGEKSADNDKSGSESPGGKGASGGKDDAGKNNSNGNEVKKDDPEGDQKERSLRDLAKDQERAAKDSESAADNDEARRRELQRQKELSQRTRQAQEEAAKENGAGSSEPNTPAKSLDRAAKEQKSAEDAIERGDMKSAAEHQSEAARAIREAADGVGQKRDEHADGESGKASESEKSKPVSASKDRPPKREIDPLAKQLVDREQRQRAQRQKWLKGQMVRPAPVDKDW